jgi:YegS/Rv2252/BmrU family lipid kinase
LTDVSTFVLVNPASRSGATRKRLPELERLLYQYVGRYELLRTEREGDGDRLARLAVERGAKKLVIAGGDGTVSEAVSGLLDAGRADAVDIALLPLGTGRDFARVLKLGSNLEACVGRIFNGNVRRIDAGRVTYRAPDGSEKTRWFLNITSIGLPAESTRWLAELDKTGRRGPLSYVVSGLVGLRRYPMSRVKLELDDRVVHDGALLLAAASNGQYFAGGMHVAPNASIDDGMLALVVIEGMSIAAAIARCPAVFMGRHVHDRRIHVHRGTKVRATSDDTVWIEVDGEPVGTLPATIEITPGAVRLCGLP